MPDGTPGRTYSFSYNTSQSFTSMAAGRFSVNDSDGDLVPVESEEEETAGTAGNEGEGEGGEGDPVINGTASGDEAQNPTGAVEGGTGSDEAEPEESDEDPNGVQDVDLTKVKGGGNGHSIDALSQFMNFASSSSDFGFNMAMSVADGASDEEQAAAEVTGSLNMKISDSSGGLHSNKLNAAIQTTTGTVADDNISFTSFSIVSEDSGGSSSHFNLDFTVDLGSGGTEDTATGAVTGDTAGFDGTTDGDAATNDTGTFSFGHSSFSDSSGQALSVSKSTTHDDGGGYGNVSRWISGSSTSAGGSSSSRNSMSFTEDGLVISVSNTINSGSESQYVSQTEINSPPAATVTPMNGPYAIETLDEDQETKMVSSNSASLSTGFDITIDEDGIDMNETFSISLPSGHSTDMKRRVHTTYSDYMGSNSDHLVEEESSQFHETTLSGNLDDGITLTQTNRNSSSTFNTTNGVAATPVIYSNNPEPVVTVIVPSAADQAAAAAATQTNEGTAGESEGDNQTTTTEGTTNPDASSESGTGSDADAFSPIVKPQGVPEGGTFDPITGNVYDADGNLFGKLDADGNVYWPLEWPPGGPAEEGESNPESEEPEDEFGYLDKIQLTLDGAGLTPGLGIFPDAANTVISLGRFRFGDAFMNALAMIPIVGQGTKGAQLAVKAVKAAEKVTEAAKVGSRISESSKLVRGAKSVLSKIGHTTPWDQMTKAQRKAFQHSYSRHASELGLPNWKQGNAEALRNQFNNIVGHVRNNGTKLPAGIKKPFNGQSVDVNFYEGVFNGTKYYYYETLDGIFISAGRAR